MFAGGFQQQGTVTTAPAVGSTTTEGGGVNSAGVPVFGGGGSGGGGMNTGRPLVPLAPMAAPSEQVGGVVTTTFFYRVTELLSRIKVRESGSSLLFHYRRKCKHRYLLIFMLCPNGRSLHFRFESGLSFHVFDQFFETKKYAGWSSGSP